MWPILCSVFLQPLFYGFSQTLVAMETFGAVTGLVTNFDKSSAHPIRCEDLDLQHILEPFQGARKDFPSAILAFSCPPMPFKRFMCQQLPGWKGRLLNRVGHHTLVTLVHHLTVFPLAVWARKQIDKIRLYLTGQLSATLHAQGYR